MRCNRGKSDVKVERLREMVREEHTERMTAQGARGWGDKKKEERGNIAQVNCRCGESWLTWVRIVSFGSRIWYRRLRPPNCCDSQAGQGRREADFWCHSFLMSLLGPRPVPSGVFVDTGPSNIRHAGQNQPTWPVWWILKIHKFYVQDIFLKDTFHT